jgi:biopolymer transport protein ExbB/TolQ
MVASALKLKLVTRISIVRHIGNSLVVLGLIGTVIGFIIALSGVDPETVGDVKAVGPMVSTLIQGMSVALYTTLVGAVLNIWLMINYQLLAGGTANLIASIVESGESHAGA